MSFVGGSVGRIGFKFPTHHGAATPAFKMFNVNKGASYFRPVLNKPEVPTLS